MLLDVDQCTTECINIYLKPLIIKKKAKILKKTHSSWYFFLKCIYTHMLLRSQGEANQIWQLVTCNSKEFSFNAQKVCLHNYMNI